MVIGLGAYAVYASGNSGQPVFLLLTSVSAAAIGISIMVSLRQRTGLIFARTVPGKVFAGDQIPVNLEVRNSGAAKSLFFMVEEAVVSGESREVAVAVDAIRSGETRRFSLAIPTSRRGVCRFGKLVIETGAPFGLMSWRMATEIPASTMVLPFPGDVLGWDCPGGRRHSGIGVESLDRSGASHEFLSAREYHPEDPMRYIHWKLMARMQRPMVRDFQTTSSLEVELVPDLASAGYAGRAGAEVFEGVVALTASLAGELIRRGYFVRLWLAGRRFRNTFQEAGLAHLDRILAELAEAVANGSEPFGEMVSRIQAGFAPRSAVVCVVPGSILASAAPIIASLGAGGYQAQLMIMDPPAGGGVRDRDAELAFNKSIAMAGAPSWRFRSDEGFRAIDMPSRRINPAGLREEEAVR